MRGALERWVFRVGAAALIAGALAYVPWRVYGSEGYVHYRKLRRDLGELEQKNAALRAENARLERDIERLSGDETAISRVARDELGMVRPGEMVIQIDRGAAAKAPAEGGSK
jgi:cell division protein FtsB